MEILELKNSISEKKKKLNRWAQQQNREGRGRISKLEYIEQQKLPNLNKRQKIVKKMSRTSGITWDYDKRSNSHVTKVPEEEEKEGGTAKVFEEIMAKDFPNLAKDKTLQIKEAN